MPPIHILRQNQVNVLIQQTHPPGGPINVMPPESMENLSVLRPNYLIDLSTLTV